MCCLADFVAFGQSQAAFSPASSLHLSSSFSMPLNWFAHNLILLRYNLSQTEQSGELFLYPVMLEKAGYWFLWPLLSLFLVAEDLQVNPSSNNNNNAVPPPAAEDLDYEPWIWRKISNSQKMKSLKEKTFKVSKCYNNAVGSVTRYQFMAISE